VHEDTNSSDNGFAYERMTAEMRRFDNQSSIAVIPEHKAHVAITVREYAQEDALARVHSLTSLSSLDLPSRSLALSPAPINGVGEVDGGPAGVVASFAGAELDTVAGSTRGATALSPPGGVKKPDAVTLTASTADPADFLSVPMPFPSVMLPRPPLALMFFSMLSIDRVL